MKRRTKILVLLEAGVLLCLVTGGFLKMFLGMLPQEQRMSDTGETVYYAALDTQPETEPTIALPPETTAAPETTVAPTEASEETVPATTAETAQETTAAAIQEIKPQETKPQETKPQETKSQETKPLAQTASETTGETVPQTTEPELVIPTKDRKQYDKVPNYYETDYPDIRFGQGSFADYGSGVTSMAMVATYLTGYDYRPDTLAHWFSSYTGNQIQLLEYMSDTLQLPWKRALNVRVALEALKEGKVVIAMVNSKSGFTTGQHFLVLTGINDAGLVTVNDPNKNNYEKWNLKAGFTDGFREGILIGGYSGSWIYDPSQISDDPFLYIDPSAEEVECRYPDLSLSDADVEMLAKLVCAEADGEPFEGQQAVAEVILNRVAASNFPSTVTGVIKAPDQFRAASQLYRAKPTHVQYEAVRRAWKGPYVLDKDVVFFSTGAVNKNVWGTIGNHTFCHQYT